MKKLCGLLMLLASPLIAVDAWVDVQSTSGSDINLYQIDRGTIDVYFLKDRQPLNLSGDVTFWYATNGLRSDAVVEITTTISSTTNIVSIPVTADKFGLVSTRPFTWGIEVDGKMQGDGRLYVKARPAMSNVLPTFLSRTYLDFIQITNYLNTAIYGPYLFTAGFNVTTNAMGQLSITSESGAPQWDNIQRQNQTRSRLTLTPPRSPNYYLTKRR